MWVQSLGQEDLLEEGVAPTPVFLLGNPMDRGAWWATVHRVAKSQTWLKQLRTHAHVTEPGSQRSINYNIGNFS